MEKNIITIGVTLETLQKIGIEEEIVVDKTTRRKNIRKISRSMKRLTAGRLFGMCWTVRPHSEREPGCGYYAEGTMNWILRKGCETGGGDFSELMEIIAGGEEADEQQKDQLRDCL